MAETSQAQNNKRPFLGLTKGGRNLVILGVSAIVIAIATTSVSLAIYHNSGDIYLDRSRPGFLPDEAEIEDDNNYDDNYTFEKSGPLDIKDIEEYLLNFDVEIKAIDSLVKPYGADALSDETLGI